MAWRQTPSSGPGMTGHPLLGRETRVGIQASLDFHTGLPLEPGQHHPRQTTTIYFHARLETRPASPLEPSHPRMGAGISRTALKAPWQGQVEEAPLFLAAGIRPPVLSVSRKCPRRRRPQPQLHLDFRFRQRFRRAQARYPAGDFSEGGLLVAETEPGISRVVCFSPKHNLTIANMEPPRHPPGGRSSGWSIFPISAPAISSITCRSSKIAAP